MSGNLSSLGQQHGHGFDTYILSRLIDDWSTENMNPYMATKGILLAITLLQINK